VAVACHGEDLMRGWALLVVKPKSYGEVGGFWRTHPTGWHPAPGGWPKSDKRCATGRPNF
jgi:hypothetical protein